MNFKLFIFVAATATFTHLTGAASAKESSPLCGRILAAVSEPNKEELADVLHDLIKILPLTTLQNMQKKLKAGKVVPPKIETASLREVQVAKTLSDIRNLVEQRKLDKKNVKQALQKAPRKNCN